MSRLAYNSFRHHAVEKLLQPHSVLTWTRAFTAAKDEGQLLICNSSAAVRTYLNVAKQVQKPLTP